VFNVAMASQRDLPGRDVPIRDEMVRLGQLLKLADIVDAGSDVRALLSTGEVSVNGEPETRRGRQLRRGDTVEVGGAVLRVV
jgi:ribosome-associated protein